MKYCKNCGHDEDCHFYQPDTGCDYGELDENIPLCDCLGFEECKCPRCQHD